LKFLQTSNACRIPHMDRTRNRLRLAMGAILIMRRLPCLLQ
jgi:hypothetical protein